MYHILLVLQKNTYVSNICCITPIGLSTNEITFSIFRSLRKKDDFPNEDTIRIVCVSDTHSQTSKMKHVVPDGDVLIHAGDFTLTGHILEVENFNKWLGTLPHKHKIVIAG